MRLHFLSLFGLFSLAILTGCALKQERLPAGDVDIYTKYASAIEVLHNRKISANSREKYEAALVIADAIDFSFCRDVSTLDKIFGGSHDAKVGPDVNGNQVIIFYFQYKNKSVRFVFSRYKNAITHAELKIIN